MSATFLLAGIGSAAAQDSGERDSATAPAPVAQAAPLVVTVDSLPASMSWIKSSLWGKRGFVRELGLAPTHRSEELDLRHSMLTWHQRFGLATWGMMTTQMVLGVLIDSYAADHYLSLRPIHRTLGYATFGVYLSTASLSITAPPGRFYDEGISSVNVHRWLAVVHFVGMMLQPWLGSMIAGAAGPDERDRILRLHRLNGWVTYAAFTGAILSIAIPL